MALYSLPGSRGPFAFKEVKMSDVKWDESKCVFCCESIEWGSGRYVNRTPAGIDDEETGEYRDGYACAECMTRECMMCDGDVALDEDVWIKNPDPRGDGHDMNIGLHCCYDETKHKLIH